MTPTQALDYLRRRFNETDSITSYWSDGEIYDLISSRGQQASLILGLIEVTDTSTVTVSGTQTYSIPTPAIALKAVLYDGQLLESIDFREWEVDKQTGGTTPSGIPEKYVEWNRQVILIPMPNDAKTLTFYYEGVEPVIDDAMDTITFPTVLHYPLMDGILADMFAKAQNTGMAQYYEAKWQVHMTQTFPKHKWMVKRRSASQVVVDADTSMGTTHGVR